MLGLAVSDKLLASRPLSPVATQHSLPSRSYPLLGPDLHRLDRTSLRLAHSFDHLVGGYVKTGRSKGDTHAAQSLADQRASAGVCRQRRPCRRATATSTGRPAAAIAAESARPCRETTTHW